MGAARRRRSPERRAAPSVVAVLVGLALLMSGALVGGGTVAAAAAPTRQAAFDKQMIGLVNNARAAHGLQPVREAKGLDSLSIWWSTKLATGATGYVLKHNPDAWTMLPKYGAANRTSWGENVAKFAPSTVPAKDIFDAYMRSPGHRANILGATYRYIGMATMAGSHGAFNTMTFTDRVEPGQVEPVMSAADAGQIADQLYVDLLGRPPPAGARTRMITELRAGTSVRVVARPIVYSAERFAGEVNRAYRAILGRAPDAGGKAVWIARLLAGQTSADLLGGLLGSAEAYSRAGSSAKGWVSYAFGVLVGHKPTAAQLTSWAAKVKTRSRTEVARELAVTHSAMSHRVSGYYLKLLGRRVSGSTVMVRLGRSSGDAAVILTLVSSAEYRGRALS